LDFVLDTGCDFPNILSVASNSLVGKKVYRIPGAGTAIKFLHSNTLLCAVIVTCIFGSIIMYKWYLFKPSNQYEAEHN